MSETLAGGGHDGVDQLAVAVGADVGFQGHMFGKKSRPALL
jgi:hypothetical protein